MARDWWECVRFVFGRECWVVVLCATCRSLRACSASLRVLLECVWGGGGVP